MQDLVSVVKTGVAILGFTFLFQYILELLFLWMKQSVIRNKDKEEKDTGIVLFLFNENRAAIKTIFILAGSILLFWLPILVLCYPGGSCVDVTAQIKQALGEIPYTTQHSIIHTFFLGACLQVGKGLFNSYNVGFYISIWLQACIMASILAYSVYRLLKENIKKNILMCLLVLFGITPIYSNLASMAIKDTLYSTFMLLFIVELTSIVLHTQEVFGQKKRQIFFISSAILVTLFRNNGIYVIAPTMIVLFFYLIKQKAPWKKIGMVTILPIFLFLLISFLLSVVTRAEKISSVEILSIPFQQTAYYIKQNGEDVTSKEWAVLESVFTDATALSTAYQPDSADPIKRLYNIDATGKEQLAYLGVWARQFFHHPITYMDAFLQHSYGWFYPGANNWIRYEARLPIFTTPTYLGKPDQVMYYIFNFLNRLPILGLLENVGFYIWGLFICLALALQKKKNQIRMILIPLLLSLLICVASPVFFGHPRYAFPIMIAMPFIWIITRKIVWKEEKLENAI